MTRSKRLAPVHDVALAAERTAARRLADAECRARESAERLAQLEGYEREYRSALHGRVSAGMGAAGLRDYHAFLVRLAEAVAQQRVAHERAVAESVAAREQWIGLSARRRAVGKVIERAVAADRRALERREQHETDERAQRSGGVTHPDDAAGPGAE